MKRNIYLSMKSLEEAREIFLTRFGPDLRTASEVVPVEEALDRVAAEPVFARFSSPTYHAAAMDGIAVISKNTYGTTERRPKTLRVGQDAVWINTGQPLPEPFDAVIMVEKLHELEPDLLEIRSPAYPWQHVRKVGEDIVATQLLFPKLHGFRPYDLGALISGGVFSVTVYARPRVAIVPTGSELVFHGDVQAQSDLQKGQILEYNSLVLAALVRRCGGIPQILGMVPDTENQILSVLDQVVDSPADLVILNAGSSAGSKDYTAHAVTRLGEVLVHGVAMMPGKPTILGVVRGKPVVGNPGYAVSSTLSFEQFVKPLLYTMQGLPVPEPVRIPVIPTRDIPSKTGIEEFVRVNIGKVEGRYMATPLARGAGAITTLTRAEGIIRIPALSEGISQSQEVEAELLVEEEDLRHTVVVIGSHDMTIDILADEIRHRHPRVRITSGNVGSLGGLLALRKGTCHIAGTHLLDVETGQYNVSYIQRYVAGPGVTAFHLTLRDQGLMVAKGNPKGIRGLEDLARGDVRFVNRQAGSGTRVLLDFLREQKGIAREAIQGYDHEEFTHMAVAVDVLSGAADCGMGIYAAARALDLDFISVVQEQYDLVIRTDMLSLPAIAAVLETIQSPSFRERVQTLGGYDPSRSGERFFVQEGQ